VKKTFSFLVAAGSVYSHGIAIATARIKPGIGELALKHSDLRLHILLDVP